MLFGATGYTGGRTAEAMARRGLAPVLAGRDPAKLAALAARLGGLETARADVTDVGSVRALVGGEDVLVSTVGPFAQLGGAALAAVVGAGRPTWTRPGSRRSSARCSSCRGPRPSAAGPR